MSEENPASHSGNNIIERRKMSVFQSVPMSNKNFSRSGSSNIKQNLIDTLKYFIRS